MAASFTVHGTSREECADGLDRVCTLLGLAPTLPPRELSEGRWIARAARATAPPTGAVRGREP